MKYEISYQIKKIVGEEKKLAIHDQLEIEVDDEKTINSITDTILNLLDQKSKDIKPIRMFQDHEV